MRRNEINRVRRKTEDEKKKRERLEIHRVRAARSAQVLEGRVSNGPQNGFLTIKTKYL